MMKKPAMVVWLVLAFLANACRTIQQTTPTIEMNHESAGMAKNDTVLQGILRRYPQYFDTLLCNNEQWRIQIIYTQIDRGANGIPKLTHHYYNPRPGIYFYPASTVKMAGAVLALQKLNELAIPGLNRNTTMITEAGGPNQTAVFNDPSSADGRPTIANYVKKIFLVSDNDAYNRLYEFLGQEYSNNTLHKMGYDSVQLLHRLQISLTEEENRASNPVKFYNGSQLLYAQPPARSNLLYQPRTTRLGNGYLSDGKLIQEPFDFSKKNRISLADLHSILQSIIFPESVPAQQRFKLTPDDYSFLYRYMSMKPGESRYPAYDSTYSDAYAKFILFGGEGAMDNPLLRIFNKVGDAYGFLQDVAYVVDFEKGVEFMLSATIYCNSDGIFNDDKYDYDSVGFPFFKHLGEAVYEYEMQREKKVKPDLQKFRFDYTKEKDR